MNLNRVSLNPSQAAWISRNVAKMLQLLEASEKKNAGVKGRTTYKVLNSLRQKAIDAGAVVEAFGEDEQYEVDLHLSKKQKASLKGLIGSVHKGLVEKVIPEYIRRGESHKAYAQRATVKAEFLEDLWRKFK